MMSLCEEKHKTDKKNQEEQIDRTNNIVFMNQKYSQDHQFSLMILFYSPSKNSKQAVYGHQQTDFSFILRRQRWKITQ